LEIEKTKRKSNAIENVFIPKLVSAVKFITFRLAEMERDTFIMLKTVKRKMGEREAAAAGEKTEQAAETGEGEKEEIIISSEGGMQS
jgi:V/A-type H+-transporting ATPase subunit D